MMPHVHVHVHVLHSREFECLVKCNNPIDFSHCFQEPGRLLSQACMLVPLQEELLVTKVCQLIVIITHQKVVLSKATVETLLEYITNAMRQCQPWTLPETLRALGAVVYENGPKCFQVIQSLIYVELKNVVNCRF